jgi:alanyl-tRNA synthetase
MVQFKEVFLGEDKRPTSRATTAQRCVRAGGKHNDLDNVGYTARHHTFFEMLGNFSFGDYFKRDAIRYAWELLTKVYGLAPERLWTTVYIDDDEAYEVWTKDIGVPAERCIRIGDNKGRSSPATTSGRWRTPDRAARARDLLRPRSRSPGRPAGIAGIGGRPLHRDLEPRVHAVNRDERGVMHPLPKPSVDTGMGLERLAAVLQHVHSNYEIDLFQELIRAAVRETGAKDHLSPSLRVIADHIRACAFLVVDGVIPGAEGRGYVLRRIVRRAIRHGYQLGRSRRSSTSSSPTSIA